MKSRDPHRRRFEAIGCCRIRRQTHAVNEMAKSQRAKLKDLKSSWLRFSAVVYMLFEFVLVNDVIVGAAGLKSEKRFTLCLDGKVWDVPTHLWSRLHLRRLLFCSRAVSWQ
jgi:hypothetical protein